MSATALGLLLIRATVGLLLAGHGAQKLFGWFGGDGPRATGQAFAGLGYRRGTTMAIVAGLTEVGAGLGLAAGIATPLVAAGVIGVMINAAVSAHGSAGLWAQNGGYEYPLVIIAIAAGVALHGPGGLSVDAGFGFAAGGWWGLGAIGIGAVSAALALTALRRRSA